MDLHSVDWPMVVLCAIASVYIGCVLYAPMFSEHGMRFMRHLGLLMLALMQVGVFFLGEAMYGLYSWGSLIYALLYAIFFVLYSFCDAMAPFKIPKSEGLPTHQQSLSTHPPAHQQALPAYSPALSHQPTYTVPSHKN